MFWKRMMDLYAAFLESFFFQLTKQIQRRLRFYVWPIINFNLFWPWFWLINRNKVRYISRDLFHITILISQVVSKKKIDFVSDLSKISISSGCHVASSIGIKLCTFYLYLHTSTTLDFNLPGSGREEYLFCIWSTIILNYLINCSKKIQISI